MPSFVSSTSDLSTTYHPIIYPLPITIFIHPLTIPILTTWQARDNRTQPKPIFIASNYPLWYLLYKIIIADDIEQGGSNFRVPTQHSRRQNENQIPLPNGPIKQQTNSHLASASRWQQQVHLQPNPHHHRTIKWHLWTISPSIHWQRHTIYLRNNQITRTLTTTLTRVKTRHPTH